VYLSGRNLQDMLVMPYSDVSAYHVLWSDVVVIEAPAIGHTLAPVADTEPETKGKPAKKAKPAKEAKKAAAKKPAAKAAGAKSAAKKPVAKKPVARKAAKPAAKAKKKKGS
jgi:septal ring-binding cell division protein DamX